MAKKVIKKKKLRVFRLLIILLIAIVLFVGIDLYLNTNIKNIIVEGTTYLKDDYLLDLAGVKDYPGFFFTTSSNIKKKLETSPYVKKATVKKRFYHVLRLEIEENRPLFYNDLSKKIVFEDGKVADDDDTEYQDY